MSLKLTDFFGGRSELYSESQIVEDVRASSDFDEQLEGSEDPATLLLFQTSRQQRCWSFFPRTLPAWSLKPSEVF